MPGSVIQETTCFIFIRSKDNTLLGAHIQMGKFSFLNVRVLLSESDRFPSLLSFLLP